MSNSALPDSAILVVTDDFTPYGWLKTALEDDGYVIKVCADSDEIFQECQFNPPTCLFLDLCQNEIARFELFQRIRMYLPSFQGAIVGLMSHEASEVDIEHTLGMGFDDMMAWHQSPVLQRQFLRRILYTARMTRSEQQQRALNEALNHIINTMTTTLDRREVLLAILDQVGRVVPHDAANILVIEGDQAIVRYTKGYSPESTAKIMDFSFALAQTPNLYTVMRHGEPLVINDVVSDPQWVPVWELPETEHGQSLLSIPIKAHGQVIGFLHLDQFGGKRFTSADAVRVIAFADQAALALTNADLLDSLTRETTKLHKLQHATSLLFNTNLLTSDSLPGVGAQIAELVVREFNAVDCGVMLVNWDSRTLIRFARAGNYEVRAAATLQIDAAGLVPEAVRTGEVVYAPDVRRDPRYLAGEQRTCSELVIPLKTNKRVVGVLDLQSTSVNAFNEGDIRLLRGFADFAAVVIENIQLLNEIRFKERGNAILRHSSDAILLINANWVIQQVNPAFTDLFGYDQEQVERCSVDMLAAEGSQAELHKAYRMVMSTHENQRLEVTAMRADANEFPADIMLSPMFAADTNQVIGVVCSIRDITARKQLEMDLQQSLQHERELIELKAMFVRHASHELRTPLAVINTSVDLLLMAGDRKNADQRAERLRFIQQQVKQLKDILNELFELNNYQRAEPPSLFLTSVDMNVVCDEVVKQITQLYPYPHQFNINIDGPCHPIQADRDKITAVLRQLIGNALQYSDDDTTITVTAHCGETQTIIQVADQGIGIPPEYHKHLFEPFYRVRTGLHQQYANRRHGAGLGLTIVKQAVDALEGQISFESQEGLGTTFTITLPNVPPNLMKAR
ncbi:MAG: GAF domain-containing protein [Anaerolineae bacterium]